MRYYCKDCGTILENGEKANTKDFLKFEGGLYCWYCREFHPLKRIPDFETPEQYQKRTGKELSDDGLVWVKDGVADEEGWRADFFWNALDDLRMFIVCVNGPLPPPDGWRPE